MKFNLLKVTDHKPLVPVFNGNRLGPTRVNITKLELQGYRFNLQHQPGKTNPADYFSRHPKPSNQTTKRELQESQTIQRYIFMLFYQKKIIWQ